MTKTNPFKFGSVVDEPYFTNRINELKQIKNLLQSPNHLILISPRRYGKTSLMIKAVNELERPYIFLDLQLTTDVADFASQLLKRIYRVYPFERLKQLIKHFRIIPTLNLNPLTNEIDISIQPVESAMPLLEDVFNTIEKLGEPSKRLVIILDEFQDINRLENGLDRKLRSLLQHHKNVNYAFLGSVESMMREIFEKKKSPFYHFGQVMPLKKIPYDDFLEYVKNRLKGVYNKPEQISKKILEITQSHPYYTQQLAFTVWNVCNDNTDADRPVNMAIETLVRIHDIDYERLWLSQNQTDKKILISLANKEQNVLMESVLRKYGINATSTAYSSLKKLMKNGYVIKTTNGYELDDPFFALWIKGKRAW